MALKRPCYICLKVIFCALLILRATAQESSPREIPRCADSSFKQPDHIVLPKYPKGVEVNGESVVELRVVVGPDGTVKELSPEEGSNPFVNAAVRAVRRWRFYPVAVDGNLVGTTFKLHINFHPLLNEGFLAGMDLESPLPKIDYNDDHANESLGGQIYRVNDPGVTAPEVVYKVHPEFSEEARKAKESGAVNFSFVVDADGSLKDIRILCSSTPAENDHALETLKLWKFKPGSKDGTPVAVKIGVEMTFNSY